ncbi:MAG: sugar ABC transporter permease [Desulfobulbaceae bacterium]|mgnify:CR=1 FL=1|nr:MAG: sugar ABC transporter permease [Desulfobulbaceae bacterium]
MHQIFSRQSIYGWLLLLPAAILLFAFTYYPMAGTFFDSIFNEGSGSLSSRYNGPLNYQMLMIDPVFKTVLINNAIFALGTIPVSIGLALMMALIVDQHFLGRSLVRMAFFTPTVLPMIAVANIWLFFYTPDIGLIDSLLAFFGIEGPNWLGDPDTVLSAIIVMAIWKEAGFFMIFYLAALQTISPELKEAAKLEGAGKLYYFRRVLFPLLMPTTLFISINAVINSFKLVDHLFILTKGGPDNASNLLLYHIYETAFSYFDQGYAAALTVVLLLILASFAIVQFFFFDRRIHYR